MAKFVFLLILSISFVACGPLPTKINKENGFFIVDNELRVKEFFEDSKKNQMSDSIKKFHSQVIGRNYNYSSDFEKVLPHTDKKIKVSLEKIQVVPTIYFLKTYQKEFLAYQEELRVKVIEMRKNFKKTFPDAQLNASFNIFPLGLVTGTFIINKVSEADKKKVKLEYDLEINHKVFIDSATLFKLYKQGGLREKKYLVSVFMSLYQMEVLNYEYSESFITPYLIPSQPNCIRRIGLNAWAMEKLYGEKMMVKTKNFDIEPFIKKSVNYQMDEIKAKSTKVLKTIFENLYKPISAQNEYSCNFGLVGNLEAEKYAKDSLRITESIVKKYGLKEFLLMERSKLLSEILKYKKRGE